MVERYTLVFCALKKDSEIKPHDDCYLRHANPARKTSSRGSRLSSACYTRPRSAGSSVLGQNLIGKSLVFSLLAFFFPRSKIVRRAILYYLDAGVESNLPAWIIASKDTASLPAAIPEEAAQGGSAHRDAVTITVFNPKLTMMESFDRGNRSAYLRMKKKCWEGP